MIRRAMSRALAGALCAVALAGCGPEAAVWLRVEAPLQVPDEADELRVEIRWDDSSGEVAFERTYPLAEQFPHTLTLTAEELGRSSVIAVEVSALKGGEVSPPGEGWARASGQTEIRAGRITDLTLRIVRP